MLEMPTSVANEAASRRNVIDAERSIVEAFAQAAAHCGDGAAVMGRDATVTYAQLDQCSFNIAAHLSASGAAGDRVAILMRHDASQLAAVLGSLKAGRIVAVLNPADPADRLRSLITQAEPESIICDDDHRDLASSLAPMACRRLPIDVLMEPARMVRGSPLVAPGDPAFIVFTSGSTGRPRGVIQSHRMVVHNAFRLAHGMELAPHDRVALLALLTGGQGVATTWSTLLSGATLCPFTVAQRGIIGMADWITSHSITVVVASASLVRHFLHSLAPDQRLPCVRIVRIASEPATSADFAQFQRHFNEYCVLFSTLSSTETGNITQLRLKRDSAPPTGRLPVGWASPGIEIELRDEHDQIISNLAPGELIIRSRYISPGYWRDAEGTAERFSELPGDEQLRVFRSGDIAQRNDDGSLTFLGRRDSRVKIRGHRVELAEVESLIEKQPGVERAAVIASQGPDESTQLHAFIITSTGRATAAESLRRAIVAALPRQLIPQSVTFLDALPMTAGGKIDRERLRGMSSEAAAPRELEPPRTPTERLLADVWSACFRNIAVGRHDDFFSLGGDSLSAAVVAAQVHARMGVTLDMCAFTSSSTIAGMAARIDRDRNSRGVVSQPIARRPWWLRRLPLSFAQERMWRYSQSPADSAGYSVACSHLIRGPLDLAALQWSVDAVVARHEILRTVFAMHKESPVQVVLRSRSQPIQLVDLSSEPDPAAEADSLFHAEARRPFDLAQWPLLRLTLIRLRPDEHLLLRVNQHIITDRWSWQVFFSELAALYEARKAGAPRPLPKRLAVNYGDYALWQRRTLSPTSDAYRQQIEWWRNHLDHLSKPLDVPCRRASPDVDARPEAGVLHWGLEPETSRRLDGVANEAGTTYFVVRLAAFAALLACESGVADGAMGIYVTNRSRLELQKMFGLLSNLVTLRVRLDRRSTFRRWLTIMRDEVSGAQSHGEIPYEQLREELHRLEAPPPPLQVIFSAADHNQPLHFGGLEVTWLERRMEAMPWGFTLSFDQHNESRRCRAAFDARIYDPDRVRHLIARLIAFIEAASQSPDAPLGDLLNALPR